MKQKQKIQSQTIKTVEIHLNIKRTQIREKKENKLSHGNANQKEKCNDYINTKKKKWISKKIMLLRKKGLLNMMLESGHLKDKIMNIYVPSNRDLRKVDTLNI